jgi:hypothetical protein
MEVITGNVCEETAKNYLKSQSCYHMSESRFEASIS